MRAAIQTELQSKTNIRKSKTGEARYAALGSGSAYGQSLQMTEQSGTEVLVFSGQADRRKIRALK